MAALPAHVAESINLSVPMTRGEWFEDIAITLNGRTQYLSVQVDHKLYADGEPNVCAIYYEGRQITMLPVLVDLIAQAIKDNQ